MAARAASSGGRSSTGAGSGSRWPARITMGICWFTFVLKIYCTGVFFTQKVPFGSMDDFSPNLFFGCCFLCILTHALATLQVRSTLGLVAITVLVSFASEAIGVATGTVFGPYEYSQTLLGTLVLGVPVCIPLSWISVFYSSQAVVNAAVSGRAANYADTGLQRVFLSIMDGAIMTMYDLGTDPVFVHNGYWTWLGPANSLVFFGVPASNFVGWFLTGTTVGFLVRTWVAYCAPQQSVSNRSWFAAIPLFYYAIEAFTLFTDAQQPGIKALPDHVAAALHITVAFTSITWAFFGLCRWLGTSSNSVNTMSSAQADVRARKQQ